MATGALNDLVAVFGPYDISGRTNRFEVTRPIGLVDYICANPPGTSGTLVVPKRDAVSIDFQISGGGYIDTLQPGTALTSNIARVNVLCMCSEDRAVGLPVDFARCARGDYSVTYNTGSAIDYTFAAMSSGGSWWGSWGAYADVSATGNGTGYQFGAVTGSQSLVLALSVERLSGTGSIVVTWKTATANTFVGEATRATFASVTALGEELITVAGAITDTWGRPTYAVTGTGVWRIRLAVAIV